MNILITGIHGFVGSNLVAALKGKQPIYGLDIITPTKEGLKLPFCGMSSMSYLTWMWLFT
jgi:nucleoside-diphosphate-sugar epimerase